MHDRNQIITVDDLKNLLGELKYMAHRLLHAEGHPQSLTPTALAISALRRAKAPDLDWDDVQWKNRNHFFGVLRMTMGHALIDHARHAKARGRNKLIYVPGDEDLLTSLPANAEKWPDAIIALEEALAGFRSKPETARLAEVIDQYYFAQFTIREIAAFSEISEKTVDRELRRARVALKKVLAQLFQPAKPAKSSGGTKPPETP